MQRNKFFHSNSLDISNRSTAVAEIPSAAEIKAIANNMLMLGHTRVEINFGFTMVNKKDKYVKKIGREYALKNMKKHILKVESMEITSKYIFINLEKPCEKYSLTLSLNRDTDYSSVKFYPKYPINLPEGW